MLLTLPSVRLSVCLSVCLLVRPFVPPFGRRTPLGCFCCCGPGGQEISIEQNILARVAAGAPWTFSSLNIRRDLHWLPVGHRITYKPCLSTLNTLQTSQPLYMYLSELISHYISSVQIIAFSQYKSPYQTTRYYLQIFLSGLFCVCTFYLELSTCTHSFYQHPIHL